MKRRILQGASVAAVLAVGAALLIPSPASAYGPSTLYDPASNQNSTSVGAMYPRAVQLAHSGTNNGKMYATFQQNTTTTQVFPVYESTDSGASWAKVGQVADTQNGLGMNTNPHLYEVPKTIGALTEGTLLAAGISSPADNSKQFLDLYKSSDLGRTWTFLSHVTSAPNAGNGDPVWEPFILVANDKVIVYYSDERDSAHSQKLVHETSTDGFNWSSPVDDVALADSSLRPGMPTVAQLDNGKWIMTYEIVGASGTPDNYQISDNPEIWNTTSSGTTITYGGSPYVVKLNDGRIAMDGYDGSGTIFINSKKDLSGSWIKASTPIASGYSRQIVPLANGRLFLTSCRGFWESGSHPVTYADMPVPGTSATAVQLINRATSLAVDGYGAFTAGSNAKQNASNNGFNEQWTLIPSGNNFLIQNNGTGLYLDGYGRTASGSAVAQYTLSNHPNQQWVKVQSDNYVRFKNAATGLYLDGAGNTSNGSDLTQSTSSSAQSQQWTLTTPPS